MTTVEATRVAADTPRHHPWRGMLWIAWRQHRASLGWLAGLTAAITTLLAVRASELGGVLHGLSANTCRQPVTSSICDHAAAVLYRHVVESNFLTGLVYLIPVAGGIFMGAPLLAREFETGRHRFVWTQGVSQRVWLVSTMAYVSAAVAALAVVLGSALRWYLRPFTILGIATPWYPNQFTAGPITLPAVAVLSFTAGVLIGAVVRRVVTAIAVTTGVLSCAGWILYSKVNALIAGLGATTTHGSPGRLGADVATERRFVLADGSYVTNQWMADASGHHVSVAQQFHAAGNPSGPALDTWLAHRHLTVWWTYQPPGRLWLLQTSEAVLMLGLAAIAALLTVNSIQSRRS